MADSELCQKKLEDRKYLEFYHYWEPYDPHKEYTVGKYKHDYGYGVYTYENILVIIPKPKQKSKNRLIKRGPSSLILKLSEISLSGSNSYPGSKRSSLNFEFSSDSSNDTNDTNDSSDDNDENVDKYIVSKDYLDKRILEAVEPILSKYGFKFNQ